MFLNKIDVCQRRDAIRELGSTTRTSYSKVALTNNVHSDEHIPTWEITQDDWQPRNSYSIWQPDVDQEPRHPFSLALGMMNVSKTHRNQTALIYDILRNHTMRGACIPDCSKRKHRGFRRIALRVPAIRNMTLVSEDIAATCADRCEAITLWKWLIYENTTRERKVLV